MHNLYREGERIVLIDVGPSSNLLSFKYEIEFYGGLFLKATTPVRKYLNCNFNQYHWFRAIVLGDYNRIITSDFPHGFKFGDEIRLHYATIRKTNQMERRYLNNRQRNKLR